MPFEVGEMIIPEYRKAGKPRHVIYSGYETSLCGGDDDLKKFRT